MSDSAVIDQTDKVKNFYGKVLTASTDLKTTACTSQPLDSLELPPRVHEALGQVHEDIKAKYFGCGPVYPTAIEGKKILDLGCGGGQDSFVVSKLVGPDGSVTGLDMTDELIELATSYIDYHTKKFNYSAPNVKFVVGFMEKLDEAGIQSNQYDAIVSNGVINLVKDKKVVLSEACRVLKNGGEIYFSDVYADRDLPCHLRKNEELWCECISGTLFWRDLYKLAAETGFSPPRLVTAGPYEVEDPKYKELVGDSKFVSVTYRFFKLPAVPKQTATVTYNGGVEGFEDGFAFDYETIFMKGEECQVKDDLLAILTHSRYKDFFTIHPGQEKGLLKGTNFEKDPFEYVAAKKK